MIRSVRAKGRVLLSALIMAGPAKAMDWDFGDASFALNNHLSEGAAWRLEKQDSHLIGKLDLSGQQDLCNKDACMSLSGTPDPAPNLRLVHAAGAYSANNGDQGDLNFQRYDVVAGVTKLDSDLSGKWRDFSLKLSGTALFDPVNANLEDTNPNTTYQPPESDAQPQSRRLTGRNVFLRDASISYGTTVMDRNLSLTVGQQSTHWGESGYVAVNSLQAEVGPPDARLYHMPGVRFNQIFQPLPMIRINTDLFEGASLEALYQLQWKPVILDQSGTFYSDRNITDKGSPLDQTLSQVPVDPSASHAVPGPPVLISSSSPTVPMGAPRHGSDWGQYGAHLTYYFADVGTELDLYYLRYTARLPNLSAMAADKSCMRELPNVTGPTGWITNLVASANACNGFNGILTPILNRIFHSVGDGQPIEPLPLGTIAPFFEYPSGIHLFGLSFNTNLSGWALSGEYSFRPDVPLQVHTVDLLFAAAQPAFPKQSISFGPLGYVPGSAIYFPSYLMRYRGEIDSQGYSIIQPRQYIQGWERRKVGQIDLTALKAISNGNWFGADQIVLVTELGAQTIYNLPNKSQLQFETGDPDDTHASPGADGTGISGPNPDGTPYTLRFNPTQQTTGFASRWSWGIREQARFEYDNLFGGVTYKPSILVGRDFSGYGALPVQNFIKGRWQLTADNLFNITPAWSFQLIYQMSTGGEPVNTQTDRDTIAAVIAYDF